MALYSTSPLGGTVGLLLSCWGRLRTETLVETLVSLQGEAGKPGKAGERGPAGPQVC